MHNTLQICVDIAEKLKDPSSIYQALLSLPTPYLHLSKSWPNPNLYDGMTGIITLYAILDEMLPRQGWDEKANSYIKLCVSEIEKNGVNDFSFLGGLTGVCYGIFLSSRNGSRYQQLLSKLEKFLVDQLESTFFKQADQILKEDQTIPPNLYNFSTGMSGVLAYLMLRKENPTLQKLTSDCLYTLIRLLYRERIVDGKKVPGWHVTQEHQLRDLEKEKYSKGTLFLDRSNGIIGCLSLLSIATLKGITVSGQLELISEIADWLKNQRIETEFGPAWPAITSNLFLAGKATKNPKLMEFAERALLSFFSKPWQEKRHVDPSFISGRAGLLVVTSQMARLTGNPYLYEQIPLITEELISFYSPHHHFGFQTVYYMPEDDQYQWMDHPGLWEGVIGIALALLMAVQNESKDWQLIFLAGE